MKKYITVRMQRATRMIDEGILPTNIGKNTYLVPSQSMLNTNYKVSIENGKWICECIDYQARKFPCKHIFAVKFWLAIQKKMEKSTLLILTQEILEAKYCKFCGSPLIIRQGTQKRRYGVKQSYKCKDCGRKFVPNDTFQRMQFDPRIVTATLDWYFKGASLRKIVDHYDQFYGIKIHYSTIHRWIRKFSKLMDEYAKTLVPELSGMWHSDEMAVGIKGRWEWLWNIIDKETRFQLASLITEQRMIRDARKAFKKAKEVAKAKPENITTDGLPAYPDAILYEFTNFADPQTKHFASEKRANNIMERMQGTVREREKVMRGLKSEEAAQDLVNGFRSYYNFIRPHQALQGKTPAEVANINLRLKGNKWLGFLEAAKKAELEKLRRESEKKENP